MAINQAELGDILRKSVAEQETAETEIVDADLVPVETEEEVVETEESVAPETTEETEEQEEVVEEVQETNIENLNDLATAIEVEPEFLYGIKIPMPGEMDPISLSELKDGYTQFKRGTTADLEVLENERAKFEEYKQQQTQQLQTQAQLPQEIVAAQAKAFAIASQFNAYDWESLEKDNPGEAALQKQKLSTAYQEAQNEQQGLVAKYQQEQMAEIEKSNQEQRTAMLKTIPEWNDNNLRVKEQDEMRIMLKEYGYSDNDISALADHRAMRLARDLWQFKQKNVKALKTLKKVAKVPKTVKAGTIPAAVQKSQKLQKTIDAAAKSKNTDVKVQAIGALLQNRG